MTGFLLALLLRVWLVHPVHLTVGSDNSLQAVNQFVWYAVIVPISLALHVIVGLGLWGTRDWARVARIILSFFNIWLFFRAGKALFIGYFPASQLTREAGYTSVCIDLFIVCCLTLYPDIGKTFDSRGPGPEVPMPDVRPEDRSNG